MNRYYFDHNATTPVSPEVIAALIPCLKTHFGNASSIHQDGQAAKRLLENARVEVAAMLHCDARGLIFVSGGTEADNLAVLGAVRASHRERKHVITSLIEHPAILGACRRLEQEGVAVTYLRPDAQGVVSPDDVRRAVHDDTVLITVMHANNELGTVQPIAEITAIAHQAGVLMHSDGVQAAGKIDADVESLGVDLYSISGHKIYAPKGCGALYVRKGTVLDPLFHSRSERDLRPGTDNVPGAVALGCAARNAREVLASESARLAGLRDLLENGIRERVPDVQVNGGRARRVPNTSNICFHGIDGEALVIALDLRGFAVSTGAACSSGAVEPSHVLLAAGLSEEQARSTIRFSLGATNTREQVDALIEAVVSCVGHLRRLSPAYA